MQSCCSSLVTLVSRRGRRITSIRLSVRPFTIGFSPALRYLSFFVDFFPNYNKIIFYYISVLTTESKSSFGLAMNEKNRFCIFQISALAKNFERNYDVYLWVSEGKTNQKKQRQRTLTKTLVEISMCCGLKGYSGD